MGGLKFRLILLQGILQFLHPLHGILVLREQLSVIVVKLLHILCLIDHVTHVAGAEKHMQIGGFSLLVHKLDPDLHGGVLLLLLRHRRIVSHLCLGDLLLFLGNGLLDEIDVRDQAHQLCIQFLDFLAHAFLSVLRLRDLLVSLVKLGLILFDIFLQIGNSGSRYRIYHGKTQYECYDNIQPSLDLSLHFRFSRQGGLFLSSSFMVTVHSYSPFSGRESHRGYCSYRSGTSRTAQSQARSPHVWQSRIS